MPVKFDHREGVEPAVVPQGAAEAAFLLSPGEALSREDTDLGAAIEDEFLRS